MPLITDTSWITIATEAGLFQDGFVPFRYFFDIHCPDDTTFHAYWYSWFIGEHGNLQSFKSGFGKEDINDWAAIANHHPYEILKRLNKEEEEAYEKRIMVVPVQKLIDQARQWSKLSDIPELMKLRGISKLDVPVRILRFAIDEKLANGSHTIVPFRYCEHCFYGASDSDYRAQWIYWFPEGNKIVRSLKREPEKVGNPVIVENVYRTTETKIQLNATEERGYEAQVKSLSLDDLRKQLNLWVELDRTDPILAPNRVTRTDYAPIKILEREIQVRMLDSPVKKEQARKELWTGTKGEFCHLAINEYKSHPELYRSERDAILKLIKQYRFPKRWSGISAYNLWKQIKPK